MPDRLDKAISKNDYPYVRELIGVLGSSYYNSSPKIDKYRVLLGFLKSSSAFFRSQGTSFISKVNDNVPSFRKEQKTLKIGAYIPENRDANILKPGSVFHKDYYHPNNGLIRLCSKEILNNRPSDCNIYFHQVHGSELNLSSMENQELQSLNFRELAMCSGMLCLNNCSTHTSRIGLAKEYAQKLLQDQSSANFCAATFYSSKLPVYLADDFTRLMLDQLWNVNHVFGVTELTWEQLYFRVMVKLKELYAPFLDSNNPQRKFEAAWDHIFRGKIYSGELNPRVYLKGFLSFLDFQLLVRHEGQPVPQPCERLPTKVSKQYYSAMGLDLFGNQQNCSTNTTKSAEKINCKRLYISSQSQGIERVRSLFERLNSLVVTNGSCLQTQHEPVVQSNSLNLEQEFKPLIIQNWLFIPPFNERHCTEDLSRRLEATLSGEGCISVNLVIQSDSHNTAESLVENWIKQQNPKLSKHCKIRWIIIHDPQDLDMRDFNPTIVQLLLPDNFLNLLREEFYDIKVRKSARELLDDNYFNPVDLINCALLNRAGLKLSFIDYPNLVQLHFLMILRDLINSTKQQSVLKQMLSDTFSTLERNGDSIHYFSCLKEFRLLGLAMIAQNLGLGEVFKTILTDNSVDLTLEHQEQRFYPSGFPCSCSFLLRAASMKPVHFTFSFKDFDPFEATFSTYDTKLEKTQRKQLGRVTGRKAVRRYEDPFCEKGYTLNKALMAGLRAVVEACLKQNNQVALDSGFSTSRNT